MGEDPQGALDVYMVGGEFSPSRLGHSNGSMLTTFSDNPESGKISVISRLFNYEADFDRRYRWG